MSAWICVALFAGMIVLLYAGIRIGRAHQREQDASGGLLEGAIFALLGLLLGFAFSGSMSRLDTRRELIVQEANAIGTAYLRLDLLPQDRQPEMRALFRSYLQKRLEIYAVADKGGDPTPAMAEASGLQRQIWDKAVGAAGQDASNRTVLSVLPALNDMIDVTASRTVALRTHMPVLIAALLFGVALLSALLAGYALAARGMRPALLLGGIYAVAVSCTIYAVLDLDNPRGGLIRLHAADQILRDLEKSI